MRSVVQLHLGPRNLTNKLLGAAQQKSVGPPRKKRGAVAQLGERLVCNQEVAGSIPTSSTSSSEFFFVFFDILEEYVERGGSSFQP